MSIRSGLVRRTTRLPEAWRPPYAAASPPPRRHRTHRYHHHRSARRRLRCCPLTGQRHRHLPQRSNAIPSCTMIVLPSCCHLCHGGVKHSFQPRFSSQPSARCRSSQPQLPIHVHPAVLGGLIGAALRSHSLHCLYPHGSGSSPGRAVAAFLSEFLILNGLVTRCALLCSNRCCC